MKNKLRLYTALAALFFLLSAAAYLLAVSYTHLTLPTT